MGQASTTRSGRIVGRVKYAAPEWDGHLLLLYDDEPQRRAGVTGWVRRGLELGSKVLYTEPADEPTARSLPGLLGEEPAALDALQRGQIEVVPAGPAAYDPDFMAATVDEALAEGYRSVRWSGDATTAWAVIPRDRHAMVEQATDELCASRPLSVMCQYFAPDATAAVGALSQTHGAGLREQLFRAAPVPGGLAVAGALDVSNQEVLRSLLTTSTGGSHAEAFVLDLAGVDFLDLPGVRALIFGTADYRDRGGQVRLHAPQRHVAQLLRLLGVHHQPGLVMRGTR
jgi:anti-anti-sigma factor